MRATVSNRTRTRWKVEMRVLYFRPRVARDLGKQRLRPFRRYRDRRKLEEQVSHWKNLGKATLLLRQVKSASLSSLVPNCNCFLTHFAFLDTFRWRVCGMDWSCAWRDRVLPSNGQSSLSRQQPRRTTVWSPRSLTSCWIRTGSSSCTWTSPKPSNRPSCQLPIYDSSNFGITDDYETKENKAKDLEFVESIFYYNFFH